MFSTYLENFPPPSSNFAKLAKSFSLEESKICPLQKHVRKVVGGFGKKSCVSTGVRKPGNTYASPTTMI